MQKALSALSTTLKPEENAQTATNNSGQFSSIARISYSGGELISKNIRIGKKRTSIRLEPEMWRALDIIIKEEKIIPALLFDQISKTKRRDAAFTAALRSSILLYFIKKSGCGF